MSTNLNLNAVDFINEVEKFSKRPLHRKAELISIYEAAIDSNQLTVFRDLCFTSKYLVGMMRVLQMGGSNPQVKSIGQLKKDFSSNLNKAIEQIGQILSESDESKKKYFEEEFFVKSQTGLNNLNELLTDLESAKIYLNYLKREKKN
jgi:flagellar hook-basal body complex protein FliE